MKEKSTERTIWLGFCFIGLLIFIFGTIDAIDTFNYNNKIDTTGTITRIESNNDDEYDVYVYYRVNGEYYESLLNGYSSSYYEGKKIEIYYDQDNPNKIGVKSLDLLFLMFPGFGLLFFIIGAIGIFHLIKKSSIEKKLKVNGTLIYATYIDTTQYLGYKVKGKSPYLITCGYFSSEKGKPYIFKSNYIWDNPENIIKEKNITEIPVYIDSRNIKYYYVDVDAILKDTSDLS